MLIDLNIDEYNKYLEFSGNAFQLTEEHYQLMTRYDYLIFNKNFNQPISRIPNNVKTLVIMSDKINQEFGNLPSNLESLQVSYSSSTKLLINDLPYGLINLKITGTNITMCEFPSSIKMLYICGTNIDFNIHNLPIDLEYFNITYTLVKNNTFYLPRYLKCCYINYFKDVNTINQNNVNNSKIIINDLLEELNIITMAKYLQHIENILENHIVMDSKNKVNIRIELYDYDLWVKNNYITKNNYELITDSGITASITSRNKDIDNKWDTIFKYYGNNYY